MDKLTGHSDQLIGFIRDVQTRVGLDHYEETHQLILASLDSLGEAISEGENRRMSAWLPPELSERLAHQTGGAMTIDRNTFMDKISGHIHASDPQRVTAQVSGVFQAMHQYAPSGELDDALAQLSPDIAALFY